MSVSLLGLLLIPVGLLLLAARPGLLSAAVVFFVPFSATAVLVYWGRETPHWLPVVNYFGLLWILSLVGRVIADGRVALPAQRGWTVPLLASFMGIAALSLMMPAIIAGAVSIQSANPVDRVAYPLFFGLHHILVLWDLVFGVLLALAIATLCASPPRLEGVLRVVVWSGLFVSVWGLLEFATYYLGLPFPYTLFNNNPAEGLELGRVLRADLVVKRITSVAVEPSILAQALLALLPIVVFALWSRRTIVSPLVDRVTAGLMLVTLLLCTSASAYAGLAIASLATVAALVSLRRISWRPVVTWLALLGGLGLVYAQSATVREFVDVFVVAKPVSDSGVERLFSTLNAWSYFLQYPILGLGWGSVPSHDLVMYLLANAGICGTATFLIMVAYVGVRLHATLRTPHNHQAPDWLRFRLAGIGVSFVTVVLLGAIAWFPFEYAHFWLILGLAVGTTSAVRAHAPSPSPATQT